MIDAALLHLERQPRAVARRGGRTLTTRWRAHDAFLVEGLRWMCADPRSASQAVCVTVLCVQPELSYCVCICQALLQLVEYGEESLMSHMRAAPERSVVVNAF